MSCESSCSPYAIYYDVLCDSNQHYLVVDYYILKYITINLIYEPFIRKECYMKDTLISWFTLYSNTHVEVN